MEHEAIISRMSIGSHPIHPMLIHFPVAALIALIGVDLAFVATDDYFWARAGVWLSGVGAAGGAGGHRPAGRSGRSAGTI